MNPVGAMRTYPSRVVASFVAALLLLATGTPAVAGAERMVSLIVSGVDAGATAALTQSFGGQIEHVLPVIDGVVAKVPASSVDALSARAQVVPDRTVKLQSQSYGAALVSTYPSSLGAPTTWASGNAGAGVTVAVIDTGVSDVPDLQDHIVGVANLTRERTFTDSYGHGTFQAGLIAGDGTSSNGRYTGIAPEAGLLSVKVADRSGSTSLGQVLAGVQLVDSSAAALNVRVALLAIDSGSSMPPEVDPLSRALRTLWSHGVLVVVPAGNDGPTDESIASPGNDPVLLTAGSVYDNGTATVSDDTVSAFTGRGPTFWGDEKPDVAVPGEHLVSLRAPGSTVDDENPNARVEDAYFKGSGTSMSAAVTAGAAALLLADRPELSPDQAKALLMGTAQAVPAGDSSTTGAGVVDVPAAIAATDVPDLPAQPNLGDAEPPFTPPGLDFGWERDDHGVAIWGPRNVVGNARSWAARSWSGDTWDDAWGARSWNARSWNARSWTKSEWEQIQEEHEAWQARSWSARQWAARSWNARSWNARSWTNSGFTQEEWMARQWTARSWSARSWNARSWNGSEWSARSWNGRSWNARQWSEEDWNARQWSARQWSARQWNGRSWNARQWSDEEWNARQWSARQWNARQWSDGSWASRSWQSVDWV